jgi:hypothetical protein
MSLILNEFVFNKIGIFHKAGNFFGTEVRSQKSGVSKGLDLQVI